MPEYFHGNWVLNKFDTRLRQLFDESYLLADFLCCCILFLVELNFLLLEPVVTLCIYRYDKWAKLFHTAVLVFVIVVLIIKLIGQCFFDIWHDKIKLEYYMEYIMSLAIGVEFVKMLCTHKPGTIIEVLLFATARQMIVEHLNVYETLVGIGAIAALFAIRKFLFCSFDEADHMICRGSQTVARANFISGTNIPEEKTKLLRDVISEKLQDEGKNVSIGACVYYQDCALRVDNVKQGVVTRVEVIKNL